MTKERRGKLFIAPSVMCMDFARLHDDVLALERAGVDGFHFDIMDGHFVPNLTLGPGIVRTMRGWTNRPFDVHLMVEQPEHFVDVFIESGANYVVFHWESTRAPYRLITRIREAGATPGVSINPGTPAETIEPVLSELGLVLLMTVEPGFAGQKLIPQTLPKVSRVRAALDKIDAPAWLGVDGNVSFENLPEMTRRGANFLVCGTSSLFRKGVSYEDAVQRIREHEKRLCGR